MTLVPDVFPLEFEWVQALALQMAGLLLGVAAFSAAGGRGRARLGAAFGLVMSAIGWCASRWPQLSRAIDLSGATWVGPFLGSLVAPAFALTAAAVAAALLLKDLKPRAMVLVVAAAALWAVPTLATEAALTRWWGFGPRTLAEAAGIPTGDDVQTAVVLRLAPSRGHTTSRENVRMTSSLQDLRPDEPPSTGVDLSPESVAKLEGFLQRTGYRGVFAAEALAHVRRGWLMWWDAEHALNAMMLSVPGRVLPDYRGALDLIKVGPMTAERFAKLEQLDAAATADPHTGFTQVTASQYIFEGFAAAYARFGDEAKARRWLAHIDNFLLVTEKKVEVAPARGFPREARSRARSLLDGRPAGGDHGRAVRGLADDDDRRGRAPAVGLDVPRRGRRLLLLGPGARRVRAGPAGPRGGPARARDRQPRAHRGRLRPAVGRAAPDRNRARRPSFAAGVLAGRPSRRADARDDRASSSLAKALAKLDDEAAARGFG